MIEKWHIGTLRILQDEQWQVHTCDGSEKKFFFSLSVKERLKSEMYTVTPSTSGSSTVTISTESLKRNPEAVNSPIFVDAPMHSRNLKISLVDFPLDTGLNCSHVLWNEDCHHYEGKL